MAEDHTKARMTERFRVLRAGIPYQRDKVTLLLEETGHSADSADVDVPGIFFLAIIRKS